MTEVINTAQGEVIIRFYSSQFDCFRCSNNPKTFKCKTKQPKYDRNVFVVNVSL